MRTTEAAGPGDIMDHRETRILLNGKEYTAKFTGDVRVDEGEIMSNNTKTENWVAHKDPEGDWHVRAEHDECDWICSLSWVGQSEERAQLLAAAPELLAEVKRLRHLCEELQGLIDGGEALKIGVEETDALIAKAEGR